MIKIGLDAGHGLYTGGKETADGKYKEWTLNSNVANYVEEYLKNYDVKVIRLDDRTGKVDIPLNKRVAKANLEKVDVLVSIHHNAYRGKFGNHSGVESYVYTNANSDSRVLAKEIVDRLSRYTGLRNRGVKEENFYIISSKRNIPQVLVEGGFMDSNKDYNIITSKKGQREYAKAVADSLVKFFNLKENEDTNIGIKGEKVVVTANVLNVREKPTINSKIVTKVYKNQVYTIIDKSNNFGLLKSKVGWISLNYVRPLERKYTGDSIVDALDSIGIDSSFQSRKSIAILNGITNYKGTANQNIMLLNLFKAGNLKY